MPHRLDVIAFALFLALGGCAGTLTGLDGGSSFACKAPDGVTCSSLSGVYANAVQHNLPALRKDGNAEKTDAQTAPVAGITGKVASSGDPIRTSPRVLRIWIAPFEDTEGDLHDQAYIYAVASAGRWEIEHNRQHIVERYRPTFLMGADGAARNKPPGNPQISPKATGRGVTLPGNQALAPNASLSGEKDAE